MCDISQAFGTKLNVVLSAESSEFLRSLNDQCRMIAQLAKILQGLEDMRLRPGFPFGLDGLRNNALGLRLGKLVVERLL